MALYSFRRNLRLAVLLFSAFLGTAAADGEAGFGFGGFGGAALTLTGDAMVAPGGLLYLTNTSRQVGHAFYPHPLRFKAPSSSSGGAFSFSSNFVFAIFSTSSPPIAGHGMAFVISPATDIGRGPNPTTLGLLNNRSEDGDARNHIAAVELDLLQNGKDIDDNHVGIDINSLESISSAAAGYRISATKGGDIGFVNLSLSSGDPMQVWVEYDGGEKRLNVTLSPMSAGTPTKPELPLLSAAVDLSEILKETMYVGFSAATGKFQTSHVILGWTFKMNGSVRPLDLSDLPKLPKRGSTAGNKTVVLVICLSVLAPAVILAIAAGTIIIFARRKRFSEVREDWEQEYGPHRFSYRDLFTATKGFGEKELLGIGGFGKVYRGVLRASHTEVAVKKVSHDSKQGMREFVAEIASIGRLRHRSLVQLLGYCRRKGELLLVYDYMPNGSLDKLLFDRERPPLDWNLRRRIIGDVASGLLYLHEGWEQVVIHRDIKASNVLLDGEFNGRVGDFGLARLYDHRTGPQTSTHVVGTMGYIAPELSNSCKFTTATDVFGFGAFLLEVAAGRRPIEAQMDDGAGEVLLVEWVRNNWMRGQITASADRRLKNEYPADEMELVLMLGLLCSHPSPLVRPSMRLATQILAGDASLPELSPDGFVASFEQWQKFDSFDGFPGSYPASIAAAATTLDSLRSMGR